MPWNEDVRAQTFDCIQRLEPIESVTVIDEQELVGEKQLAQIHDAVLGNVYDAVTSRVSAAYIENLNLFSAKMERDPLTIGLIRKSRFLLLGWRLLPLHLIQEIGTVIFMADLDNVLVGDVTPRVVVVEGR